MESCDLEAVRTSGADIGMTDTARPTKALPPVTEGEQDQKTL